MLRPGPRPVLAGAIVTWAILAGLGLAGLPPPSGPGGALVPPSAPVATEVPASAAAAENAPVVSTPTFTWSTAQIYYGPGDPSGLLFGEGAVMAVDNRYQNTVSFGGRAYDGLSNITLVYENATNGTWWYAGSPDAPAARANASFSADPALDAAVLFGGLGDLATSRTYNDTWVYYFGNETWVNVTQSVAPAKRENAAFAIDPKDGVGLLVGGIDPHFVTAGSTGTLLWNDTWLLNLTTLSWTPLVVSGAPPALYGSSMVWDPVASEFVLFGGCGTSRCTDGVWTYAPGASSWSHPTPAGSVPSGRGSAAFAWDPVDNVSLLYGGFAPGPTGPTALGGTYYLDAAATTWTSIPATGGPAPTYGAASAFSDYPGCVGFWVQGGSPALDGIITNDSLLEPTSQLRPNCFTPFGGGTGGGPPSPCSNTSAHLALKVQDAQTGAGLPDAAVTVSGSCGTSHGTTGPGGFLNLTEAAPDILSISVLRIGFHGATETVTYSGTPGDLTVISLEPLPALHARVWGLTVAGRAPLGGASVSVDNSLVIGATSPSGWANASSVPDTTANLTVGASATNFGPASVVVPLPYTGVVYANLTLSAYGPLEISVRDNATGRGIDGATITLTFVDPIGANTTTWSTGPDGWFNASFRAGNYSVAASAPGYFPNRTGPLVVHGWINATVVVVNLSRVYGADVSVQVLNSVTGLPVVDAVVTFGGTLSVVTGPSGWGNATNLGPPGQMQIGVRAWGYYPNFTTVTIGPYVVLRDVLVRLTPAPPCSPFAACPTVNGSFVPPQLSLIPPPGVARTLLLAAPLVIAVAGAIVVAYRVRVDAAAPPPSPGSRPPAGGERPTPRG